MVCVPWRAARYAFRRNGHPPYSWTGVANSQAPRRLAIDPGRATSESTSTSKEHSAETTNRRR